MHVIGTLKSEIKSTSDFEINNKTKVKQTFIFKLTYKIYYNVSPPCMVAHILKFQSHYN